MGRPPTGKAAMNAAERQRRHRARLRNATIPITQRALLARLDRALAKDGRALHIDRRGRGCRWLLVDTDKGQLLQTDVNLEALGHKIGALEPWERLEKLPAAA
jgi:hypothetical protein